MEIVIIAIIGIFGLIIFSSGEDISKNEVASKKNDDESFYKDDDTSSFSSLHDDSSVHAINPASGAPMIDEGTSGIDTLGNSFGNDDIFEIDTHSEFWNDRETA